MKNILILFSILTLISSCIKTKKETNVIIENYIALEYGSFDNNGELIKYVSPMVLKKSDKIGKIINNNPRRIKYLITNRINSDTLNKLIPDSTSISRLFKNEISKKKFIKNFTKIVLPNKQSKEVFTEKEMMIVASKFFLAEKLPDNSFGTRICSGINGIINNNNKDYTLLEVIVFDAIFSQVMQRNNPNSNFLDNEVEYRKSAVLASKSLNPKTQLTEIRNSIFNSMEKDTDLRKYLLNYCEINENNIPIRITVANNQ